MILGISASSAAMERLFNIAGKVIRPDRCRLTDNTFQKLMFIRCNNKYLKPLAHYLDVFNLCLSDLSNIIFVDQNNEACTKVLVLQVFLRCLNLCCKYILYKSICACA